MKTIIIIVFVLISFISYSQTTKSKKDVKVEEVPYKSVEIINADGTLNSLPDAIQVPDVPEKDTNIYSINNLEVYPEFPGGKEKLALFLSKNIQLTDEMKKNKVNGKILSLFTIEKDGSITDIKVVRGLGFDTENEVLRVLKLMPKWKPGMLNGKMVRSTFSLPINIDATKQ